MRMRTPFVTAAMWAGFSALGLACPICFQAQPGPVSAGVRAAVIVLISVTGCVLGGFAVFIRRLMGSEVFSTNSVENTSDPITSDPV